MSSAATNSDEAPQRGRRRDDMPGQQQQQTQDVVIDRLTDRLSAIFQPQLKDIKDQLANLITRREHEKDLADVTADIAALQRDHDRLQDWADKRPRESADVTWVKRIETDVTAIQTQLRQQPAETRAWFNTAFSGGGCLSMIVMALIACVGILVSGGISVIIALVMRGG